MSAKHFLLAVLCLVFAVQPLHAQTVSAGGSTMTQTHFTIPLFNLQFPVLMTLQCPETAWAVFVTNSDRGLTVGPAWLQRAPDGPAVPVLKTANIADNITLYHNGSHLNDMRFAHASNAIPTLNASDVGSPGMLVTITGEATPRAAAELRSRGLSWLCTWNSARPSPAAVWR